MARKSNAGGLDSFFEDVETVAARENITLSDSVFDDEDDNSDDASVIQGLVAVDSNGSYVRRASVMSDDLEF